MRLRWRRDNYTTRGIIHLYLRDMFPDKSHSTIETRLKRFLYHLKTTATSKFWVFVFILVMVVTKDLPCVPPFFVQCYKLLLNTIGKSRVKGLSSYLLAKFIYVFHLSFLFFDVSTSYLENNSNKKLRKKQTYKKERNMNLSELNSKISQRLTSYNLEHK